MMMLLMLLQVSTQSLLEEMTDLDRLTRPANYTNRQASSYDRKSHQMAGWWANGDAGNYLRKEDGEFVMAEAEGPGAIVRIWSANPSGVLKIHLDGKVVLKEIFQDLLTGKIGRFPSPFSSLRARGCNLYFPFPYQKSMKVTCTKGGQYYHVNYRTYSKEAEIKTYDPEVNVKLPKLRVESKGEKFVGKQMTGKGVVRRLEIALAADAKELRKKTIEIMVDGERCVWSPLGDFFGTAPGRAPYDSLLMGITKEGVGYCNFPMPFEKSFQVNVDADVTLWTTKDSRPFRFYSWWRGSNEVKTQPRSDWPVLHVEGKGRLVGCFLSVGNPVKQWWGEGDEKIWVDGENFPSTFGTGTEDYFGYAWCSSELFQAPYHNQTKCDGPGNYGNSAVARFHVLDDIPFQKSIKFRMEIWHWKECTMRYNTVAYWYAEPGCRHEFTIADEETRRLRELPKMVIKKVQGAQEAEELIVVEKSAGTVGPQDLGFSWEEFSGQKHLWWRDGKVGDVLKLEFTSPKEGPGDFIMAYSKSFDYGIAKVSVHDHVLEEEIDLFNKALIPVKEKTYRNVPLKKGKNVLRIEMIGTNPEAVKKYMFGFDYLRIPE